MSCQLADIWRCCPAHPTTLLAGSQSGRWAAAANWLVLAAGGSGGSGGGSGAAALLGMLQWTTQLIQVRCWRGKRAQCVKCPVCRRCRSLHEPCCAERRRCTAGEQLHCYLCPNLVDIFWPCFAAALPHCSLAERRTARSWWPPLR